jgi:hypothetical protein
MVRTPPSRSRYGFFAPVRRRFGLPLSVHWLALFFSVAAHAAIPLRAFSDADLDRMEKTDKTFVVYTWSPHMNLSVRGLDEALAGENKNGTKVIAILDPACDRSIAEKIAKEHGWPDSVLRRNESASLLARGFRIHFPTYQFVAHGRLQGSVIPGYKSPKELTWFRQRFLK